MFHPSSIIEPIKWVTCKVYFVIMEQDYSRTVRKKYSNKTEHETYVVLKPRENDTPNFRNTKLINERKP